MPTLLARTLLALLVATLLLAPLSGAAALPEPQVSASALHSGFEDTLVATIGSPTALAFTPDGRMLITTQPGKLWVKPANAPVIALDLAGVICANSERGLLGVAVDPAFASNGFIYLYYTHKAESGLCQSGVMAYNRVSRFTLSAANVASGEVILLDNLASPAGNHNGGDLNIGQDGYLYVGVGDGGSTPETAQQRAVLNGKILRIQTDGAIPPTNPFQGAGTARCNATGRAADPAQQCQEVFAYGLRNPFRLAFDPNAAGTRFFINDVGQNTWEEIDEGQSGANYGWSVREGHCANGSTTNCGTPPAGMTNPLHDYGRDTGCGSITGGAFVPNGVWPAAYTGAYLFSDYVCGRIFLLTPSGGTWTRTDFVTGLGGGSAVHLRFGPSGQTQDLYYTTYAGGGQVRRLAYTATPFSDVPANHPAYAAITALAGRGVIHGYGDGRFGPDDVSLRAQMAALIARAVGWESESHGNTFPDQGSVDDDLWRNVGTLAFYGVALGYEDGTYRPTDPVLHIQVLSFISRAMVRQGLWTRATADDPTIYPNVQPAPQDRLDLITYVQNAGPLPDLPVATSWADWDTPATRGWFARVLWQALGGGN